MCGTLYEMVSRLGTPSVVETDMTEPIERVVRTQCASNCGGRSALECHVLDGRLRHVRPGPVPDDAYAGLCVRCLLLPEWVYSADRLVAPMRRVAGTPRGPAAEFETISWDTALDAVAGAMRRPANGMARGSVGFLVPPVPRRSATTDAWVRCCRVRTCSAASTWPSTWDSTPCSATGDVRAGAATNGPIG